ncbi:MAG: acyl-CoA dehydrogenase family protein [Thermodesulfobacteriota bacterium]
MAEALDEFRDELRTWLAGHLRPELKPDALARLPESERVARLRAWQRTLAQDRWVGITWPREHGGREATIAQQIAYTEEMTRVQAPPVLGSLGVGIAGPPIIAFGNAEQKERFPRRILSGEDLWCFGFSEPGAGSDLASLRTSATLDGDHFVVNGQKVWTTLAHHADWCMLLCRTNPEEKRAKGVSCLLVDMRSPGITVKPLRQMTGEAEFNEIFFENVHVPRANLLGELHGGWPVAVAALQNERGILYVVEMRIQLQQARDHLLALAREYGAGGDAVLRQELAQIHVATEVFRMTCQRTLDKLLRMGMPGPEASIIKLHWTEITQAMPTLGMQILGQKGLLYDAPEPRSGRVDPGQWLQRSYLGSRAASIASGTSEIMKGIIAMQVLGLPRGQ